MTSTTDTDEDGPASDHGIQGEAIQVVRSPGDMPAWTDLVEVSRFLHEKMHPWEDSLEDVRRGIDYAMSDEPGRGGFIVLASVEGHLAGAVVFLETGMAGYVPEVLLLFACVNPEMRGRGLGRRLIEAGLESCTGQVKLHVEPDNPARRLYERLGFSSKYLEMRWSRS